MRRIIALMVIAFSVAASLAAIVLMKQGIDPTSIKHALQVTARFSFLLFWCAYAGGALEMFGAPFGYLKQRRREFGLSFAAAHLVHVALVVWLYRISVNPPLSNTIFVFFAIALFWIYLIALGALVKSLANSFGTHWRTLVLIGSEYISFAFLVDFLSRAFDHHYMVFYLPFFLLSVVGTYIRLLACLTGTLQRS